VLKSNDFERFSGRVNIDFAPVNNFKAHIHEIPVLIGKRMSL